LGVGGRGGCWGWRGPPPTPPPPKPPTPNPQSPIKGFENNI